MALECVRVDHFRMDTTERTDDRTAMLEALVAEATGEAGSVTEVIRPSAIVPETAARRVLFELTVRDIRSDGVWLADPSIWRRFDGPVGKNLIGSIQVAYGMPTRYEITIFRATVTKLGTEHGWTVTSLCDDALQYGDLSLANCPRAGLAVPPKPFRLDRP
ncbi:MAG TPA: hypothetical protein VHB18_02940 [Mycobacteriales bacterium]|jgi:hypothetical protein|nr:hypothetical protein [Mycobacteriales bacterium]